MSPYVIFVAGIATGLGFLLADLVFSDVTLWALRACH